jgi:S-DNA-T family DNA segregation ATPase FtsK/SpoIIIE
MKRVAAAGRLAARTTNAGGAKETGKKGAAEAATVVVNGKVRGKSDLDNVPAAVTEAGEDGETMSIKFPGKTASKSAKKGRNVAVEDEEELDEELEDEELVDEDADGAEDEESEEDEEETPSSLKIRAPVQKKDDRQKVIEQLEEGSKPTDAADYQLPAVELLVEGEDFPFETHEKEVRTTAKLLEKTFANFGFTVKVVEIQTGPVIAQYEIELEKGLRLAKITNLADDIAIALRVPSVRIVAPIPGKNTVGIEVPNGERQIVRLREIIERGRGQNEDPDLLGQRRVGPSDDDRPGVAASLADRRPHRHRQERVPQLDHRVDADDAAAR